MTDIDKTKLRSLDLTGLLVFLALMRHRKAVLVAEEIGLTQSSISHALKRLRDIFDDPLFLRRPHGLEPTAVAVALEPQIRAAVETLNRSFAGPTQFDPETSRQAIRIAAYDYELAVIVPGLVAALELEAPCMQVSVRPLARGDALQALGDGVVDLALGLFWDIGPSLIADPLYEETYLVVARRAHSPLSAPLTLKAYASARHLVVSLAGDLTGVVDESLVPHGLSRQVVAAVPLFFPALATVAGSDLVATLPSRLVTRFADAFDLTSFEPPLAIRPFTISAVRHRRDEKSPMHDWLVGRIRKVTARSGF